MFQRYFLLKPRKQKCNQVFIFLILYLHDILIQSYTFIIFLNKTANTTKCIRVVITLQNVSFNQNWFQKRYLNCPTNVTQIDPQTLLKLTHECYWNWLTNVTQIDPRTLLKLTHECCSNWPTNVTQIDPRVLPKLTHKRYSNWSTSVTKFDPQIYSNHSHKKWKDSLETRAEPTVLCVYVKNQAILEPILLYRASKCKQTKEQGSEDCLWTHIFTFLRNYYTFFFFFLPICK